MDTWAEWVPRESEDMWCRTPQHQDNACSMGQARAWAGAVNKEQTRPSDSLYPHSSQGSSQWDGQSWERSLHSPLNGSSDFHSYWLHTHAHTHHSHAPPLIHTHTHICTCTYKSYIHTFNSHTYTPTLTPCALIYTQFTHTHSHIHTYHIFTFFHTQTHAHSLHSCLHSHTPSAPSIPSSFPGPVPQPPALAEPHLCSQPLLHIQYPTLLLFVSRLPGGLRSGFFPWLPPPPRQHLGRSSATL